METQIARNVSELFGVRVEEIQILNRFFYFYERDNKKYVARVLDNPDFSEQQTEVTWINYLADHGIGIPRATPSVNGALVEKISLGETPYFVVNLERAQGSPPTPQEWNRQLFKKL